MSEPGWMRRPWNESESQKETHPILSNEPIEASHP